MSKVRLEFTVEPFSEGRPGPHVRAAIDAVGARGLTVDMGPFSSSADGDVAIAADAVADMLRAAFGAGASRISLQVNRIGEAAS